MEGGEPCSTRAHYAQEHVPASGIHTLGLRVDSVEVAGGNMISFQLGFMFLLAHALVSDVVAITPIHVAPHFINCCRPAILNFWHTYGIKIM